MKNAWWGAHLSLLALLILACINSAQAELQGENLIQPFPAHFKIGSQKSQPALNMTEAIPENETVNDWSEMITTQIFFQLGSLAPSIFLQRLGQQWVSACPNTTHSDIKNGTANNYPVSMLLLSCPKNPGTGKPETTLLRAIQGTKSLYVVQYAFRHEQNQDLVSKAAQYLGTINVCDAGSENHPCPDLKGQGFTEH